MGINRHRLEDFENEEYKLIAIHSSRKEDYKVAYFINSVLQLFLVRESEDLVIDTEDGSAKFSYYQYQDEDDYIVWKVVANKSFVTPDTNTDSTLFNGRNHNITKQGYLFPELKNVDYLVKIEETDEYFDIGAIIDKLNSIKIFSTAYELRQETIKNKKNLIF